MMKKLSLFIVFGLAVVLALNFTFNNSKPRNIAYPDTKITGNETPMYKPSGVVINSSSVKSETYMADSVTLVTAVETGGMSIYDLQSNGVPQHCTQDPANPLNIHTVYIVNQTPGWPGADRRVSYFFSSNGGTTFDFLGDVPENTSAGFPALDVLSNGSALITNHTVAGGGNQRTQVFADAGAGNGVFTRLDPGELGWLSATTQPIWPAIIATKSVNDPVKYLVLGSRNITSPVATDTLAWINRGLSITSPSYSGYQPLYDINNANTYNFGRSAAGKIGLVYIVADMQNPLTLGGDVQYRESNDNGVTWSTAVTVLDATPVGAEVYGALRGVDVAFMGETPKVVMEYIRQDPVASTYYPGLGSKILLWSPNVNSGNYVVVADSATHPQFGNPNGGATDVYTPICRPTIGVSSDNNMLFCAFEVSRQDTDAIGSHFYDVFLMNSPDGGATWRQPTRITNQTGPVRDYRFVSMSPTNNSTPPFYFVNMVYQKDSIPGSVTQTPPAAESMARQIFAKVTYQNLIGIKNIGTETPNGFVLHQNYPNPFNPVTNIRFEIPVSSNVELNLYNSAGQLVGTLLNENVSAGVKEYRLDASALSSGIYFYTIKAGSFTDTKKMILVK